MKLLVGLGNPGEAYANTRHNAGFMVLDSLAERLGATWKLEKPFNALVARCQHGDDQLVLVKPQTFMNNSGDAAIKVLHYYKVQPSDAWAVYDDVDVPFGRLRVRVGGRGGGHQGVNSLIAHLGENFGRFKVGISLNDRTREPSEVYVLKPFTGEERKALPQVVSGAADAILSQLEAGELIEQTYELTA